MLHKIELGPIVGQRMLAAKTEQNICLVGGGVILVHTFQNTGMGDWIESG